MSERVRDAVVVGAGPAGLAFAIAAARRGLDVTVLERRGAGPLDKACGEGLLPGGVRALEGLGVLPLVPAAERAPIAEIRWIEPAGAVARLRLPPPGGLGIRRVALSAALMERARAAGVEVVPDADVTLHRREAGAIRAFAADRSFPARVLVAADGLSSRTRRREGLDVPAPAPGRFGIRRHYAVPPWAEAVEVHFGAGAEAYVTPAGEGRVGIAILFERTDAVSFERLLARFPALETLVSSAPHDSAVRGAGPFERRATARVADRLVLLGDAAGYVDAVTGDGVALALGCAQDLAGLLPAALSRGATRDALRPYEAAWRRRFRPYAAWTRAVLALGRHPAVRRRVLSLAAARPAPFERVVAAAVG
ncbi:MAG TPA: NAD(P)/FAD-dependent oxidoreductase [Anaeromyxobacter sp.]|nr:NAD(P)/FAD-dependent oxidoreductase [Anaeromyxobacter sp.]